jgi:hypothetical protein
MLDTNVSTRRPSRPGMTNRSSLMNRHSYAGLGCARRYPSPPAWAHGLREAWVALVVPEIVSACYASVGRRRDAIGGTIDASGSLEGLARGDYLSVMPRASTSVSSIYSLSRHGPDENLTSDDFADISSDTPSFCDSMDVVPLTFKFNQRMRRSSPLVILNRTYQWHLAMVDLSFRHLLITHLHVWRGRGSISHLLTQQIFIIPLLITLVGLGVRHLLITADLCRSHSSLS